MPELRYILGMKLGIVYGTRPESIKLGPVVAELRLLGLSPDLVCTGQHTTLLSGTPAESDLALSASLGLGADGSVWRWVKDATKALIPALDALQVDGVVVQGDTMSALAGARAAFALGVPLFHVEAGIRSHATEEPYPEEKIRVEIARLAAWHYAPTPGAVQNLIREGVEPSRVILTGNPVVSALSRYANATPRPADRTNPVIVVTMHRREAKSAIPACVRAAYEWAREHPEVDLVWPMHPGTRDAFFPDLAYVPSLRMTDPMPYRRMVRLVARAIGVATDSGGLQEECATLGVPCAVLRRVTDRPESVARGIARLFPPSAQGVTDALDTLVRGEIPRRAESCYGEPDSAAQIARHLVQAAHDGRIARNGPRLSRNSTPEAA